MNLPKRLLCPEGHDERFLHRVLWAGESTAVVRQKYNGAAKPTWDGMIRCGECGEEIFFTGISEKAKQRLDRMFDRGLEEIETFADELHHDVVDSIALRKTQFREWLRAHDR